MQPTRYRCRMALSVCTARCKLTWPLPVRGVSFMVASRASFVFAKWLELVTDTFSLRTSRPQPYPGRTLQPYSYLGKFHDRESHRAAQHYLLANQGGCRLVESSLVLAFIARCPRCRMQRSQSRYTTVDLDWFLSGNRPIEAHCSTCGESWALSDDDRARLARFLGVVRSKSK